ncbi:Proenkephalin-A, partial [Galemys pyrenaicus]
LLITNSRYQLFQQKQANPEVDVREGSSLTSAWVGTDPSRQGVGEGLAYALRQLHGSSSHQPQDRKARQAFSAPRPCSDSEDQDRKRRTWDAVSPTSLRHPSRVNPMARFLRLCTWLLALVPGLLATVQAECSQDCATCSYRLARLTDINPLACTLECEGKLPSLKTWEACKELLQLSKLELPQDGTSTLRESSKQDENHLLAKKYGGFMKRYGGFMKKMDELYPVEPEDEGNGGEIIAKRYGGFMKKDAEEDDTQGNSSDLLKELLGTGDNQESNRHQEGSDDEEVNKRYGGFMRSLKRSPQLEDEAKELQKRYGGFMRRVGRPEWWMDYQKRYGGFLKRFADTLPSDE